MNGSNGHAEPSAESSNNDKQIEVADGDVAKEEEKQERERAVDNTATKPNSTSDIFQINVKLPHKPYEIPVMVQRSANSPRIKCLQPLGFDARTGARPSPVHH